MMPKLSTSYWPENASHLSKIDSNEQIEIRELMDRLLQEDEEGRRRLTGELSEKVRIQNGNEDQEDRFRAYCALFIDTLAEPFTKGSSSYTSPMLQYLELVNSLPVHSKSKRFPILKKALEGFSEELPHIYSIFDQIQLLYLLVQLTDYQNAKRQADYLKGRVPRSPSLHYLMYQLGLAEVLYQENRHVDYVALWLELISYFYQTEGLDVSIYLLLAWIRSIRWNRDTILQSALLGKIYWGVLRKNNINSAIALLDIYMALGSRMLEAKDKMRLTERLTTRFTRYLSPTHLHDLYFFAGSYATGASSSLKDSIRYFKFSNFYLNRCWREQGEVARFLRKHMEAECFCRAMPFIEQRIMDMGNQMSMHSNAYVESLEQNYDKIQTLLTKVEELSITDGLTGLKNRRFLEYNIFEILLLASRHRVSFNFAMVDIDFFKQVNDTWGHAAGDYVLKELARLLTDEFRKSDVIIRFGGEEFLVILFDSSFEDTLVKMEMMRAKVQEHTFMYQNQEIKITVSIGLNRQTVVVTGEEDLWNNIAIADNALYKAKNQGRNQVHLG